MKSIYYLTGRGGKLNEGLGEGLLMRGYSVSGREVSHELMGLTFQEQLDLISDDLAQFWTPESKVIAVSYGAYLLLHALIKLDPCPTNTLLISPILGGVQDNETMKFYRPPRADELMNKARTGAFPKPEQLLIHVGEHDWQSIPKRSLEFTNAVGGKCIVVPNKGHNLGKDYVSNLLDSWL